MSAPDAAHIEDSPLRKWRRRDGRTILELAQALQTTEATLSRVETGANPPSRELELRIVKITSLTRDEIIQPWVERLSAERGREASGAEAGA